MSEFRDRLVSSPVYFPHWPLEKVLSSCHDLWFHKFEGFSEWVVSKVDWRGDPAAPRHLADSMGISFTSFHLPMIRGDEEAGIEDALIAAAYAAGLGAKIILFKAASKEIFARTTSRFLDGLDQAKLALTPVLQNHFGTAISTIDDYRQVFASIDNDPRMKAVLEVGHFQRANLSWERGWDYLDNRVALIHVNDIHAGRSVPFGRGQVDFRALMRRVISSEYSGDMVVELELANREFGPQETIDGVKEAVALLERYHREAEGFPDTPPQT